MRLCHTTSCVFNTNHTCFESEENCVEKINLTNPVIEPEPQPAPPHSGRYPWGTEAKVMTDETAEEIKDKVGDGVETEELVEENTNKRVGMNIKKKNRRR